MAQLIGISILAFPRRTEQEHTLVNKSTREVCLSTLDSICTALLPSLPYFSRPDGWLLPPRSRAHIQCIIHRSNQHAFLSYMGSMPDTPTKPHLAFVQSRAGALCVHQPLYQISFTFRLCFNWLCEHFRYQSQAPSRLMSKFILLTATIASTFGRNIT